MSFPGARSEAHAYWARLEAEYERYQEAVRFLPTGQMKIQEDLRRYLCLRCAGFLEQVTFVVIHGYLEEKSSGPTLAFSQSWFERAPNLNANAFARLVGRFGTGHAASFDVFLTSLRKEALGDLLAIRNDVAHGKVFNGQRLAPERYVRLCEEIYDWLIETFLADSAEVVEV